MTTVHRQAALQLYHRPVISLAAIDSYADYKAKYQTRFHGQQKDFPENLHIVTLKQLSPGQILFRLEHIYAKDEDPKLSMPVTVDLTTILQPLKVKSIQELSLGANEVLGDINGPVTFNPQDIRTFIFSTE